VTEVALQAAKQTMTELERLGDATPEQRRRSFLALRELDRGMA
jgi:hypothetical protein